MPELARRRADALAELARDDPGRAVASAFGADELAELRARSPDLAPDLEERGTWQGVALPAVADDFENGRAWQYHVYRTAVGEFDAYGILRAAKVVTGDSVEVSGILIRGRLAVLEARRIDGPAAELYPSARTCDPTGEQRLAVFLVYQPGQEDVSFLQSKIRDVLFGPFQSLDRYVRTASFGRAWVTGDIFGPFESERRLAGVEDLARKAGVADLSLYRRVVKIGPDLYPDPDPRTAVDGSSSVGCWPPGYSVMAVDSHGPCEGASCTQEPKLETLVHEFGHSLGLLHARTLEASGESLLADATGMTAEEYGDPYDPMGDGPAGGFFSARNLRGIGWLETDHIQAVEGEGSFFVHHLDGGPQPLSPMALRVRRWPEADEWLWLESRSASPQLGLYGFDIRPDSEPTSPTPIGGALVRIEDASLLSVKSEGSENLPGFENTHLLDMSLGSEGFAFESGRPWNDPHSPLSLTIDSVASTGMTVRVERVPGCSEVGPGIRTFTPSQQAGVFAVQAADDCAWQLRSAASWIQLNGGSSSRTGPAEVGYRLETHAGNDDRSGRVWIGNEAFDVVQQGRPVPPVIESLHPKSGSGASGAFRVAVSDANASSGGLRQELNALSLEFNSGSGTVCSATYEVGRDQFLLGNSRPRSGQHQLSSDGCALDLSKSTARFVAGKAFVDFQIAFSEAVRGALQIRASAWDQRALGSDEFGSWSTDASAGGPPEIQAFLGSSNPGRPSSLRLQVADPDGAFDIASVQFAVRSKEGPEWCGISLHTASDTVDLTGYDQPAMRSQGRLGGPPLENEYCTVVPSSLYRRAEHGSSDNPVPSLDVWFRNVYFSPAFAAPKDVHIIVRDRSGNSVELDSEKDLPPVESHGSARVLPGTVSPSEGSGPTQRFEWTLLSPGGDPAQAVGKLSFQAADRSARCEIVVFDNKVYTVGIDQDTRASTRSDSVEIGGDGTLENDLCSVDVAGMTDEVRDDRRVIAATVEFKPALGEFLSISLASTATEDALRGTWAVGDLGSKPRIAAVVNAASLNVPTGPYWFAPLEAVRIVGANLGPESPVRTEPAGLVLADELAGTRVRNWKELNGGGVSDLVALPPLLAGQDRVETVVPLAGSGRDRLGVQRNDEASAPVEFLRTAWPNPDLFTADGSGVGQALAENADGSSNGPENPAPAGSVITLHATGTGYTIWSDAAGGGTTPLGTVSVIIGNRAAEVVAAVSEAPGQSQGTTSIRARISASAPSGPRIPVSLVVGEGLSQPGVTVAVAPAAPPE